MLKIKRERLDELEKFGFKKERLDKDDVYIKEFAFCAFLYVNCADCEMWIGDENPFIPNVVYDLIEAGMVEKEEKQNERD